MEKCYRDISIKLVIRNFTEKHDCLRTKIFYLIRILLNEFSVHNAYLNTLASTGILGGITL